MDHVIFVSYLKKGSKNKVKFLFLFTKMRSSVDLALVLLFSFAIAQEPLFAVIIPKVVPIGPCAALPNLPLISTLRELFRELKVINT